MSRYRITETRQITLDIGPWLSDDEKDTPDSALLIVREGPFFERDWDTIDTEVEPL